MIVVKSKIKPTNECVCDECGAELLYEAEDVYNGLFGAEGVDCPGCGKFTFIESDKPRITPKFPNTFYHAGTEDNLYNLTNEETQKYVDQVMTRKNELKPGEFYYVGAGDTRVCLLKYEYETEIVVSKNNWEDSIED